MTDWRPEQTELIELANRYRLALVMGDADPGFHLSNHDMKIIEWALRNAADGEERDQGK